MKKETDKAKTEAEDTVPETVKEEKDILVNQDKVGSMIHEARVKKGIKISDAAKDLCIRSAYLEAIESSNYEEIPEPPYGIGFIRSYAEYLGLNSARMVQLFKEETVAASKNNDYYVIEPQTEVTAPNRRYLMISLLAIAAVYFVWFLYNERQDRDMQDAAPAEEYSESVADEQAAEFPLQVEDFASVGELAPAVATVPDSPLPVVEILPTVDSQANNVVINEGAFVEDNTVTESKPVSVVVEPIKVEKKAVDKVEKKETIGSKPGSRVTVKIKDSDTWVEVKDANKLYISKVLRVGETYEVPGGSGMMLSVGRSEGIEVLVDGKVTNVVSPLKKTGIALDTFLNSANR